MTVKRISGVFTSIIRRLGVLGVEAKEVVSIDADGIGHTKCGRDSPFFQTYFCGLTTIGTI